MYSRYTDPRIVKCEGCGWQGKVMDCYHGYSPISSGDVEPCDYCPECSSDQLIPIEQEPAEV